MIFETIIVSTDAEGMAHVTPFGVKHEGELVVISPFKPSKTLTNIVTTQACTMNLTDDVRVFAGALTQKQPWTLIPTTTIKGFRLENCLKHVELALVEVREDAQRPQMVMQPVATKQHASFEGFNRAQAAVIELAVLASRLHLLPAEKVQSEFQYLQIAIDKTAGDREREAWGWISEKVNTYYQENPT